MTVDRSLCAICAWRGDCKKKFMQGEGLYCPDYSRDISIRARNTDTEAKQPKRLKGRRGKKVKKIPRGFDFI
jgi:hypothetical protein